MVTSGGDVERTLMRLRSLWKSLLSKNEKSLFVERKLCRTKMVRFLEGHLSNPCEKARYLALDLLCGTVPRLDDKTDELLKGVAVLEERLLGRGASKDVSMKAFHFLRAYSRKTSDLGSFIENFRRLGLEGPSYGIRLSCIHGVCIIFDEDVGDPLFTLLVPPLAGLLKRQHARPSVLRSTYRTLRRIHETVGDDRFSGLMNDIGREAVGLYSSFLNFEEDDPYLNCDLMDCSILIAEYKKKMASIPLERAFDIVDAGFLERISASRECQRAMEVGNFASALKRTSWNESQIEPHALDLIKMAAAFLADRNRTTQMSGLEVLKEIIARMGFHLAPHLTNLVDILRETLASPNSKVTAKTERVLHKLMRSVHPMTVVWELLRDWEPRHKESVLRLVCGELKCFSYCDFDLASLCATVAQEMEDVDLGVREASRECVRLLLNVMQTSPVPSTKDRAVRRMLSNTSLRRETLYSLGISDDGFLKSSSFSEDSGSNTAPSTARNTGNSTSTLVSDSTFHSNRRFPDTYQLRMAPSTAQSTRSELFTARTRPSVKLPAVQSLESLQSKALPSNERLYSRAPTAMQLSGKCNVIKSGVPTTVECRKAYSSTHQRDATLHPGNNFVSRNCESMPNFKKEEERKKCKQVPEERFVQEHEFFKSISRRFSFTEHQVILPSPISPMKNDEVSPSDREEGAATSPPVFASSTPRKRWRWAPQKGDPLAGGDISEAPQMDAGGVESWIHRYGRRKGKEGWEEEEVDEGGGDCNQPRVEESGGCTLVSMSSDNILDPAVDEVNSSSGCQVQSLDPKKYNFNILRISTPKTTESVRELDEYETIEIENLAVLSPTLITTPGDSEEFSISRSSRPPSSLSSSYTNKRSTRDEQMSRRDPIVKRSAEKTFDNKIARTRCSNLNKDKICKASSSSMPKDKSCDKYGQRISTGDALLTSSTLEAGSMPQAFREMASLPSDGFPSPSKRLPANKTCDASKASSKIGGNHPTAKKQRLKEESGTSVQSKCEMPSPCSDKLPFNPLYYKLTDVSCRTEEGDATPCAVLATDGNPDENGCSDWGESVKDSDATVAEAPSLDIADNRETGCLIGSPKRSVSSECKSASANKVTSLSDIQPMCSLDVTSTRPFPRRGSKKPVAESSSRRAWGAAWIKGKDIPRTPDPTPLGEHTQRKDRRPEESAKKSSVTNKKAKCAVAKEKRSSSLPQKKPRETRPAKSAEEVAPEAPACDHGGVPEESSGITPSFPDGFGKCPWRRDLEYASKGGTCAWSRAFEESVAKTRPFPSTEAAEQEMKKALEHLEGKAWKSKEEAMWVVVRLALHHPVTLQAEGARVVAGVCGEVRNFRQSVAGKAVLTAGYLYDALGKRMENGISQLGTFLFLQNEFCFLSRLIKLRAVVGVLLTKSGNRTLSSYFRLVIQSLFRIVNASSPQKAALAFVHEGSRHPNKASRETAAQFLAILTETLGPGNSLSGPMASHMLKCAAHFAFDCSPLTRYCGKRMFRVLMRHPHFEKLKEHHLDVGTAQNLTKVLESVGAKGVDEELLPINIIK